MFSNKTPQIVVNPDYTILEQVCTVCKHDRNKNNWRPIEAQIVQERRTFSEPRTKFTGSYQKKACS